MKKTICILFLLQIGIISAQSKIIVSPYGEKISVNPVINNGLSTTNGFVQLGGELTKPTTLNTNTTNTLAVNGLIASTDKNDIPLVATADGTLKKSGFPPFNITVADLGTVMAIDGRLEVAQEITALMGSDFSISSSTNKLIGYINNVLIDNKNTFIYSSSSNSFTVKTDGIYSITINALISVSPPLFGKNTSLGVWCDTDNTWVALTSSEVNAGYINLTLLTSIPMSAAKTYSFRGESNTTATIKAIDSGGSGSGPVTFFSIKRLR